MQIDFDKFAKCEHHKNVPAKRTKRNPNEGSMFDAYNYLRTISLILTCFYQVIKEWDEHKENVISFTTI